MSQITLPARKANARAADSAVLAYLAVVVTLALVVILVWDPTQTGTILGAVGSFIPGGLYVALGLGLFLLPAGVLSLHIIGRAPVPVIWRVILGVGSWAAWYVVVVATVVVAGTFGLWPEGSVVLAGPVGAAGGVFALVAAPGLRRPPGRFANGAALIVAALVIGGCFVTAGWWGSPT